MYSSVGEYAADIAQKPYLDLRADVYMGIDLDKNCGIKSYLERAESDRSEYKNGSEAYFSAPLDRILKPDGIGLMLTKEDFSQAPGVIKHCIEILPTDAPEPD